MVKILVQTDEDCEMACVSIDEKRVMEGNFWDFHPGCHNINEYGNFTDAEDLADRIQRKLKKENIQSEIIEEEYTYQ